MRTTIALVAALVAGTAALPLAARPLAAQGGTPISAAKRVAGAAAAKATARNEAASGKGVSTPAASAAAPTASVPAENPAAKPAGKPVEKPAAQPARDTTKKTTAAKPAASKPAAGTRAAAGAAATGAAAAAATKPVEKRDSATAAPRPTLQAEAGGSTSVSRRGAASEMTFAREVYDYPGRGRRDPFLSLLKSGDLRPLLSDLKLVTVLYDPTGRNSVAIMRDLSTKDQYRVKAGQTLGRMRVTQIQPKQLVFTIEEFGYSRQEILALTDSTSARPR